jgi:hypothetical protein
MQINTENALALLARQKADWPAAHAGYEALSKVKIKTFCLDGLSIKVQYNPARKISSAAQTEPQAIAQRRCFLCEAHLPTEQESLPVGERYLLLCNPYPIFPAHFTIAARRHTAQQILPYLSDLLNMSRQLSGLSLFYNGPQSGASAPDHLHFQAVSPSYMPMDEEIEQYKGELLTEESGGQVYLLSGYLRNGFVIEAAEEAVAGQLFERVYQALRHCVEGDTEPRMNVFCRYKATGWQLTLIPRRIHRPRQYYAQGEEHLLTAPGAADIGGVFITSRSEDFEKINPGLLRDIYTQIAFTDEEIRLFAGRVLKC